MNTAVKTFAHQGGGATALAALVVIREMEFIPSAGGYLVKWNFSPNLIS